MEDVEVAATVAAGVHQGDVCWVHHGDEGCVHQIVGFAGVGESAPAGGLAGSAAGTTGSAGAALEPGFEESVPVPGVDEPSQFPLPELDESPPFPLPGLEDPSPFPLPGALEPPSGLAVAPPPPPGLAVAPPPPGLAVAPESPPVTVTVCLGNCAESLVMPLFAPEVPPIVTYWVTVWPELAAVFVVFVVVVVVVFFVDSPARTVTVSVTTKSPVASEAAVGEQSQLEESDVFVPGSFSSFMASPRAV